MSATPQLIPEDAPHDANFIARNPARDPIEVEMTWTEAGGRRLVGRAVLPPGDHDADLVGLLPALEETASARDGVSLAALLAPVEVRLDDGPPALRRTVPHDVGVTEIADGGLRAVLFEPPSRMRRGPPIVCLEGSGGGYMLREAALLAGHGFPALALAYSGAEGLPDDIVEIPLEYFDRARTWLAARLGVRDDTLVVLGRSRGGELALLLASLFPFRGVVAYVPSSQTHGAAGGRAAWTWRGEPLPWTEIDRRGNHRTERGRYSIRPGYESTLADPAEAERTRIKVEDIAGPIMLVTGGDDRIWPSDIFAQRIADRATRREQVSWLHYPQAGHMITAPNQPRRPARNFFFDDGGTPEADAAASRDSWTRLLAWLRALDD